MKERIRQTIFNILEEKKANGDVLPYAMSIEVAHRLHLGMVQVEQIAKDIEGITKGKTLNGEYYYYE